MDIRTLGLAMLLAAALSVTGCASAPRAERYVAPVVGTTWTYQHQDSGSYGNGTSEAPGRFARRTWDGREVMVFEGPQSSIVAQADGSWIAFVGNDGKATVSWDPPTPWDWPLEAGKNWKRQYKLKFHAQNREAPVENSYVVEAYEEVTVPAGTFKTFRVRSSDTLGNNNVVWYSPELGLFAKQVLQRTEKHPQGPGRRESVLKAYSPAR